ncbi:MULTISPECIES: hypothetical protein [Pirellulaceae]|nr:MULTISPECIES: hypothetical protein [Pirellulaceae]
MATMILSLFLLTIAFIAGGIGSFGAFQHSQGKQFLLPQKVCMGLSAFGLFTVAFVVIQMMK